MFDDQQVKLQREKKTALEVEAKQKKHNEALLKRESGLHKNEGKIVEATRKQKISVDNLASKKLLFSKEKEVQKKQCQKENEILAAREFYVQQKENQVRKDKKMVVEDKDSMRDQNQSLLEREECVNRINAKIKGDMKDMLKIENAVKRGENSAKRGENAVTKRENAVKKYFAKQKKVGERMTLEQLGLEKLRCR